MIEPFCTYAQMQVSVVLLAPVWKVLLAQPSHTEESEQGELA